MNRRAQIIVAGGCFWGVEEFFRQIDGVLSTEVGYAQSQSDAPTYQEVCSGVTGAVEAVKILYNPESLPLNKLLEYFFLIIDPTLLNQQGNDVGTQYRTGLYYNPTGEDAPIIHHYIQQVIAPQYAPKAVVVEVEPLNNYWPAEEYHQHYLQKNPNGYCHIDFSLLEHI